MAAVPAPAVLDHALLVLALNGGNTEAASRDLKAAGVKVSGRALRNYRQTPRYAEIQERHADEIRKHAIARFQEGALLSLQLYGAATRQALTEAEAGELKDAGKTAQNAAIAAGVAVDKALLLDGKPTTIVGTSDVRTEALALLRELSIESTAEPIETPLLPERASANARGVAPSQPAD